MLFATFARDEGCECIKCGHSEYEGIGTVVKRKDGMYDTVMICSGCLFKAAVGEKVWNKALGKTDPPVVEEPKPIKPRMFG